VQKPLLFYEPKSSFMIVLKQNLCKKQGGIFFQTSNNKANDTTLPER